jgi:hypothetical protein
VPPIPQKYLPIGIVLSGGPGPLIPFTFGVPGLGAIRPQEYGLSQPARGQVIHTAADAFLDTFGQGVSQLQISGHTGWGAGLFEIPGIILFKAFEFIVQNYHTRQQRLISQGQDPAAVKMLWLDTLNLQALSIYPMVFQAKKTSSRPLLYYYTFQAVVLMDYLGSFLQNLATPPGIGDAAGLGQAVLDIKVDFEKKPAA